MYQFIDSVDPREHDAFVKAHPLCDLLQSSAWAEVKSSWDHQIVGLRKRSRLAASALILIRRLPLGLCMMYIPRGLHRRGDDPILLPGADGMGEKTALHLHQDGSRSAAAQLSLWHDAA